MSQWLDPAASDLAAEGRQAGSQLEGGQPVRGGDEGLPPPDLAELPVAGLTRRRLLACAVTLAVAWLAIAFLRQVGDVTAASARADSLAAANQQLVADIASLEGELSLIQRQQYVEQQARAYGLGTPREVPFTLQQPLPTLGPDAPGSAEVRVGADGHRRTPLESWLTLLFGPAP